MLVITRKVGEKIMVGHDVELTVVSIMGTKVRLGIDAPADTKILRKELWDLQDGCKPKES